MLSLTPHMEELVALARTYNPALAQQIEETFKLLIVERRQANDELTVGNNRILLLREMAEQAHRFLHIGADLDAAAFLEPIIYGLPLERINALNSLYLAAMRVAAAERAGRGLKGHGGNILAIMDDFTRALDALLAADDTYRQVMAAPLPEKQKAPEEGAIFMDFVDAAAELGAVLSMDAQERRLRGNHARDRFKAAYLAYRQKFPKEKLNDSAETNRDEARS